MSPETSARLTETGRCSSVSPPRVRPNDRRPCTADESGRLRACLQRGAEASSAAEVGALRSELRRRWHGDPCADDLAEALHVYLTCPDERSEGPARAVAT